MFPEEVPLFQKMSCSHIADQWQPGLQTLGSQNPEPVLCAASSHFMRHLSTCQRETDLRITRGDELKATRKGPVVEQDSVV